MKRISLSLLAFFIMISACKKNSDGTSNTLLLSDVRINSLLQTSYLYSSNNDLIRFNDWKTSGELIRYTMYEYGTDGLISKRKLFDDDDVLESYYAFTHDNAGRLSRVDRYGNGTTLSDYRLYEYDKGDRVIKISEKNAVSNKTTNYTEYSYNQDGLLETQKYFVWNDNKFYLSHEIKYTPAGKNVYAHWKKFMMKPDDLYIGQLTASASQLLIYSVNGDVAYDYTETASDRQYNGSGYVTKQTITRHYNKPAYADEEEIKEYAYIK